MFAVTFTPAFAARSCACLRICDSSSRRRAVSRCRSTIEASACAWARSSPSLRSSSINPRSLRASRLTTHALCVGRRSLASSRASGCRPSSRALRISSSRAAANDSGSNVYRWSAISSSVRSTSGARPLDGDRLIRAYIRTNEPQRRNNATLSRPAIGAVPRA